jgi:F0F1-type ATP synthase membrane subunit c/vacuolar-type H+-ATPase subunit K
MNATSGFSGLSAVSTGPQGTGGTAAAPATATSGGVMQGVTSLGATCAVCQNPTVRQGLFFLAVVLLAVFWFSHIHSLLD